MDQSSEIEAELKALRNLADNKQNTQNTIEIIAHYFEEQNLSDAKIDLAFQQLFDASNKYSLISFLKKKIEDKSLNKCKAEILKLIRKLIQRYPRKIQIFVKNIIEIAKNYATSAKSANEREAAVQTMSDLVSDHQLDFEEVNIADLIKELMMIFDERNPSIRFLQYTYELLGLLSKRFPAEWSESNSLKFRQILITQIENLYTDSNNMTSMFVIAGAVNGLKCHLNNCAPSPSETKIFDDIYRIMKELCDPDKINTKDKVAFRNTLALFSEHGSLVSHRIFSDYLFWDKILKAWIKRENYDDKRAGIYATYNFHNIIAEQISMRSQSEDERVLVYFMKYFKKTLQSSESQPHEVRIAIKGIGLMAEPYKILLSATNLIELFDLVMERTEYSYHTKDRLKRREVLEHLPNYIESLSSIVRHLSQISGIQLLALQNVIIILIKDFHYLSNSHHYPVVQSLLKTFKHLEKLGGRFLDQCLETIIFQGIVYTCSHQLVYDLQETIETVTDWKETITYRKYLPLWKALVYDAKEYKEESSLVYKNFMLNIFEILNKLNLGTKKRIFDATGGDREFFFNDPSFDQEPINPKDFMIFYNLVDFCWDLFTAQSVNCLETNFQGFLDTYMNFMCQKSEQHPLVSGFLKFVEIGMLIIRKLNYVGDEINFLHAKKDLWNLLNDFVKELLIRAQKTSGELQISCLRVIFETPIGILKEFLLELPEIFEIGFTLGKSMLWLANHALKCFEQIVESSAENQKARQNLLKLVLPCFDTYFQSKTESIKIVSKTIGRRNVRKYLKQEFQGEADLVVFQRKLLAFLGNFDPDECLYMLESNSGQQLTQENTLVFRLKLNCNDEFSPAIFLDPIVQRVSQLTLSSSDRATKVSACELLHGLVLFKIGRPELLDKQDLELWRHLMQQMIVLGASSTDLTCRQLFEPLLMQVVHFYTHSDRIGSSTTTVIVETIYSMISHQDPSIQDLSARLLREMFIWAIKQTSPTQRNATSIKLVEIFVELKKLSINVDENKRKGATLAFNNIYKIIREEETLINIYWFFLLDVFCTNFKISEELNVDGSNDFEQLKNALDHLTRVVIKRKDVFQQSNTDRIKPVGFKGILIVDLEVWLFEECGSKYSNYRRKIMQVFMQIVNECGSLDEFVREHVSLDKLLEIGEKNGIAENADLKFLKTERHSQIKEIYAWNKEFEKSLDFWEFCFKSNIVQEVDFERFLRESNVFGAITYYLEEVVGSSPIELIQKINEDSMQSSQMSIEFQMASKELENLKTLKCSTILKIIEFFTILLPKQSIMDAYLLDNQVEIVKLLKELLFSPQYHDFKYTSSQLMKKLDTIVKALILHSPNEFCQYLIDELIKESAERIKEITDNCDGLLTSKHIDEKYFSILNGLSLIAKNFSEFSNKISSTTVDFFKNSAELLLLDIFNGIIEEVNGEHHTFNLSSDSRKFASKTLEIILNIDNFAMKLVKLILEEKPLKKSANFSITHGEFFLQTFTKSIFNYFTAKLTEILDYLIESLNSSNFLQIIEILTDFNDFIYKYKFHDNQLLLNENLTKVFEIWPKIFEFSQRVENPSNCADLALINLVLHLAMISPLDLHDFGSNLIGLKEWILGMISRDENSLELKIKSLGLLPLITHQDDDSAELRKVLFVLQAKYIPLNSRQHKEDSLEHAGLVAIMKKLLDALETSKSPIILQFLIEVTIADNNHIMEHKINKSLMEFTKNSTRNRQLLLCQTIFEMFQKDDVESSCRLVIIERFLLVQLNNSSADVVLEFFQNNCIRISTLIGNSQTPSDGKGWKVKHGFVNRCGAFLLIETFFGIIPKERIFENEFMWKGTIDGRKFLTELIKLAKSVRKECYVEDDSQCLELFRKLQCYAYRALCCLVCNTQEKLEIYNVCLFKDNNDLWKNLIDIRNANLYSNVSQDFEDVPKARDFVVSIKQTLSTMQTEESKKADSKYLRSISVFESSLSQSLTKTDLNYSVILSNREVEERQLEELQKTVTVNLEATPINDHEVMSVLVGVINHLFANKITPQNVDDKTTWYRSLASSLASSPHKNVRLFLAKLIENCRQHFKLYAKVFLGPIMQVITEKIAGDGPNYFVTDLVAMLLSWHDIYKPTTEEELSLARYLLAFLIENAYHERREIFKLNLELIKKLVELWKGVSLPLQFLLDSIQNSEVRRLESGIQLNAIMLANDLTPWSRDTNRNSFLEAAIKCCKHENAKIYQPASQLLGMCLEKIFPEMPAEEDENHKIIEDIYKILDGVQRSKPADFLKVLYGIHKNFPKITDRYLTYVCSKIPTALKKDKLILLEIFLARMEHYGPQIYRQLFAISLQPILKQKDFQKVAVHILNKSMELVAVGEAEKLLEEIFPLIESFDVECKSLTYEMMMFVYGKFNGQLSNPKKIIKFLMRGLIDPDQEISNRVLNFFASDEILTQSFKDRFLTILRDFYDPALEKHFLHYASFLLLEIAVKHRRSAQILLNYDERSAIHLQEYHVSTKMATQSIPPMFLETQQKQLIAGDGSQMQDLIRATQDNDQAFSPTQDPAKLTQVTQNFTYKETQNSLNFSLKPQYLNRRSHMISQETIESQMSDDERIIVKKERSTKDKSFDYFRRRIAKDKNYSSRMWAKKASDYRQFSEVKTQLDVQKKREGNVVLYRRYRTGDYPDLFFNSLALLLPLQALVKKDETIARAIFVSIFNGLIDMIQDEADDDREREFFEAINNSIQEILKSTANNDGFLFSTLIELVLKSEKDLKISPEMIVNCVHLNNMMVTGILFLESQIIKLTSDEEKDDEESGETSQAKRLKFDSKEAEKIHWLKLSELYYSLSEYEIISGIFNEKMSLNAETSKQLNQAIEFESEDKFREASLIYLDLIKDSDNSTYEAQKEYYYRCYYNSMACLSDWGAIHKKVSSQVKNYEKIWDTSFNADVLLPNLMRAELRQVLTHQNTSKEFPKILENWLENEDRREYILSNFGEEMAMFLIADEQYKKSSVEAERVLKQFSMEWTCLDFISEKLRSSKLMNARNVAELYNFTHHTFVENVLSAQGLNRLYKNWVSTNPKSSDSLLTWDTILLYRKYLYKIVESQADSETSTLNLKNELITMQLKVLDVAVSQKNAVYVHHLLKKILDQIGDDEDSESQDAETMRKFQLGMIKYHLLIAEKPEKDVKVRTDNYCSAWNKLNENLDNLPENFPVIRINMLEKLSDTSYGVFKLLPLINEHPNPEIARENFWRLMGPEVGENLGIQLIKNSLDCLKGSIKVAERMMNTTFNNEFDKITGEAYLKLGRFCYNCFKEEELEMDDDLQNEMVISILRAIDHDCPDAMLFIPCILQLPKLKNNNNMLTNVFNNEIEMLPEFVFLDFLSQILSNFDFENDCYLDNLILKISKKYPRAIYYPFKISYEHYKQTHDREMEKPLIQELIDLIESPLLKRFVSEIGRLCLPENMILFHFKDFKMKVAERKLSYAQLEEERQKIQDVVFKDKSSGQEFRKIDEFEVSMRILRDLIASKDRPSILEHLKSVIERASQMDSNRDNGNGIELHRLSNWLAEYKWVGSDEFLELPGQYSGSSKPVIDSLVKIVRFESKIKIYQSKQKPMELKVYGSDGKMYKFIIKYGEDLRQDQRIQQILKLMNDRLGFDKNCRANNLKIQTYLVTPLNYFCGMLSVIENTTTIRDFIQTCSTSMRMESTNIGSILSHVRYRYKEFLYKASRNAPTKEISKVYSQALQKYSKEEIVEEFENMEKSIPHNVLKLNLQKDAISPETFYILRKNLINSLVAMNIAHWILGVGDRHLSNCLIDRKTGTLIGIDFGLAFGAGTRNLPIPELIPFRLTSHFVNILEPMGISGLIRKNMIHTLRCFRNVSDTIVICLEIFTKEPTIDWLNESKKKFVALEDNDVLVWDPETRVKLSERKLLGANPRKITEEELSSGMVASDPNVLNVYLKILNGEKGKNIRAELPDDKLSVDQQVSCLVDLATDNYVLGSTYFGWDPWF